MRRREKGPAASEVSGKRRRKSRHRITNQVESGSGDPNAGEHRARNTELHPQGSEAAIERHAQHPESQVPGGTIEEEIPGRERGRDGAEGEQGPGPGVLHVRPVLGAILSA